MHAVNKPGRPMGPIVRTSTSKALVSLIRNPLEALPPAIFDDPIVFSKLGGEVKVYIADPGLIHELLVKNADVLVKGEQVRRALGPALGQGLLTSDGTHWKWQRQSVASAFRHDKLLDLQPAMLSAAQATRDRWLNGNTTPVDIGHEMMRTTFDIIVETMMSGGHGIDVAKVEQSITDFLGPTGWTFALSVLGVPEWMPYPGRRKAHVAIKFLRESFAKVITSRRLNSQGRQDLVAMLLTAADPETGRVMSDDEMVDNLMTFITAGHETTALGLAWTFDLLARHPEYEAKVVAEIDAVTGGQPLSPEDVAKLVYTRQVFSEAMRLYPPAPVITRTAMRDFELGEFTIPAGTVMYVPIYAVHHHRALWQAPEVFDPERFTPENSKGRHRYAYMPFGAGPRVCIGSAFAVMEGVAVLAILLKSFRLTPVASIPLAPVMKVTLRPKGSLMMNVEKRVS
jgi:cytochrome P450